VKIKLKIKNLIYLKKEGLYQNIKDFLNLKMKPKLIQDLGNMNLNNIGKNIRKIIYKKRMIIIKENQSYQIDDEFIKIKIYYHFIIHTIFKLS